MSKTQTFLLTMNPKNGTIVIPKEARNQLGLDASTKTLLLTISNNKAEIQVPKYTAEDVLYTLSPFQTNKILMDNEIREAKEEAAQKYLKK